MNIALKLFEMKISLHFKRELDLVNTFQSFLKSAGLPNQSGVILEFEAGHGIADIVIYGIEELGEESASAFAKIPPRYAAILGRGLLPKKFSAQYFSEKTGTVLSASARVLNQLVKQGALKRLEDGDYENPGSCVSPIGPIVAIEAKLRDWRSAVRQAYRYREFSNQSWVLMDTARISPALDQLPLFVRSGIGLASMNTSGQLFIHHEPPVTEPFSESRYWAACVQLTRSHLGLL